MSNWQNRQSKIQEQRPAYPFIQWANKANQLAPLPDRGGAVMIEEQVNYLNGTPLGAVPATFSFNTGEQNAALYIPTLECVIITSRFSWVSYDVSGRAEYHKAYVDGARGKVQALLYVKGYASPNNQELSWLGPVMLTLTGMATKDFFEAVKAHRLRVNHATKGALGSMFFGVRLYAGPMEKRGTGSKSSMATPFLLDADFDADRDFVGDDLADEIEARYPEYEAWAIAWKNAAPQADVTDETPAYEEPPDELPEAPNAPQTVPQMQAAAQNMTDAYNQWSRAWNELSTVWDATPKPLLNNAWKVAQIVKAAAELHTTINTLRSGQSSVEQEATRLSIALAQL